MRDKFLAFGTPLIGDEEVAEVLDTLASGWLGTGPKTRLFEERFAAYVGARHAVGSQDKCADQVDAETKQADEPGYAQAAPQQAIDFVSEMRRRTSTGDEDGLSAGSVFLTII